MELGLTLQRAMTGHGSGRLDTLADKPPARDVRGTSNSGWQNGFFPTANPHQQGGFILG